MGLAPVAALGQGLSLGAKAGKLANGTFGLDEAANLASNRVFQGVGNSLSKHVSKTSLDEKIIGGVVQVWNDIVDFISDTILDD